MDEGIEAETLATTLQKITASDRDLIVSEVFVRNPASSPDYILGPCFRDGFPSELASFYPLAEEEKLLLHTLEHECLKHKTWNSWPNGSATWNDWVDRLEKVKGETWRSAGIYDAILLSKINIPLDKDLLYAGLCFWSISSNSFHFNFGMMGPTVLDIVALTRLRPHGEEINANAFGPFQKVEKCKKLSYGKFIEVSMKRGDVTEDEHTSFLNMWLCKYVFCNGSLRVTSECTQLAVALAEGRKLALAPFVLSHLYRGCRNLVTKMFGRAGGPFWILQLWLQSYFPEHGPVTHDSQNCSTYGVALAQGKLKPKSFQEYFKFFYSCSSRQASQFTPFSSGTVAPEWLSVSQNHRRLTSSKQELRNIRSCYLISRDLHYGLVADKTIFSKAGVEYYSPNQFARQFGMTQAVPLPPHQSANSQSLERVVFQSANCVQEVDSRFIQLKDKFSVVHFKSNPKCTPSFESWWSTYIRKTRRESAEQILDRIFQSNQTQMQKNFQPGNTECQATKKRRNAEYIPQHQKFKGQERDEGPSKKAKRELSLVGVLAVHGSNRSSTEAVNCLKSNADTSSSTSSLSSDEDSAPLSSMLETESKACIGGDISGDKTGEVEDFFARVKTQLQHAQTPGIDVKPPTLKMSRYSAQELEKAKAEVEKLLIMPWHEVILPENCSILNAALPIYVTSPLLSVEKAHALKELERNLPSVFSGFHQAKKQQDEYYTKTAKKVILVDELTKGQEHYADLEKHRNRIDTKMNAIRSQISELKASLKEEEVKRKSIEEQEMSLKNKLSAKLAALEKLGGDSEKEVADSLAAKAEASWDDYKQKIIGEVM